MKLSLSWIVDHIAVDYRTIDVASLVDQFNRTVAEIETFYPVQRDTSAWHLVTVAALNDQSIEVRDVQTQKIFTVSLRTDAFIGAYFLVKHDHAESQWVTLTDMGSSKEGLFPALWIEESNIKNWRQYLDTPDYIIEVDNKSINHRPDLWSYRGIARECAALLRAPLKPLAAFVTPIKQHEYRDTMPAAIDFPYALYNKTDGACRRLAAMQLPAVKNKPSALKYAMRLAQVDSRPINFLVDATNYVMLDIGQPMHAFDREAIKGNSFGARFAQLHEKINLLDGTTVELDPQDIVIADDAPLSLAGVIGGKMTGVQATTRELIIEAATFDGAHIRRTALRHKKRSEASARFEKGLDAHSPIVALERYVHILKEADVLERLPHDMYVLGNIPVTMEITVHHATIEHTLGARLTSEMVINALVPLGFDVFYDEQSQVYVVKVPYWRTAKDCSQPRDIIEEIGRSVGYNRITPLLPQRILHPRINHPLQVERAVKKYLAFGCALREVYTYALYDEELLRQLKFDPYDAVEIQNPGSTNYRRLVTSLIPNLLGCVQRAAPDHDTLGFFEAARVWQKNKSIQETRVISALRYNKHLAVDFYAIQQEVIRLCAMLSLHVNMVRVDKPTMPWWMPYQTAYIVHNGSTIGTVGIIRQQFVEHVALGYAAAFELDLDYLRENRADITRFTQLAKYPTITRDVSMLISNNFTVEQLQHLIAGMDDRITTVILVDTFTKPEWQSERSVTLRYTLRDPNTTLTKEEADRVERNVIQALTDCGAQIR